LASGLSLRDLTLLIEVYGEEDQDLWIFGLDKPVFPGQAIGTTGWMFLGITDSDGERTFLFKRVP